MFDLLIRKKTSSEYILTYAFYLGLFSGLLTATVVFIMDDYFKGDRTPGFLSSYIPWGYPYNTAVYIITAAIFVFLLALYYARRGLGVALIEDLEGDLKL